MQVATANAESVFEALGAEGPAADDVDELMLYGQFIGNWDFDWTGYDAEGNETFSTQGEWLFTWVLEGRAVQDVWICPARALRPLPEGSPKGEYGTTVRMYDPAIGMWRIVWIGPGYGNLRSFIGYQRGDEIVQETRTAEGEPMQWIFADITPESYNWRSQILHAGNWRIAERMAVRRRGA